MPARATVCIWLPGGFSHFLGNGHGGLEVETAKGEVFYITWLPANRGGSVSQERLFTFQGMNAHKKLGFATILDRTTGQIAPNDQARGSGNEVTLASDMVAHAGLNARAQAMGIVATPHYMIDLPAAQLPARQPGQNLFGVSIRRIKRYWKRLLALPPGHPDRNYGMFSTTRNCNAVVAEALLAGGLWMYATPPDNTLFQDARTLLRWAEKAEERILAMNAQHQTIVQQLAQAGGAISPQEQTLPSLAQWKTDSDKGIAFWASRIEQVAALDRLIPLYHRARARDDRPMQYRVLMTMQFHIYSHLTRKPKSDRRQSVLRLAERVDGTLEKFFEEEEARKFATDETRHLREASQQIAL